MPKMTYEQKQIVALRTAVQMIASVLNDTQKKSLRIMLDAPKETMEGVVLDEFIEDAQEVMAIARDIVKLD